jgi:hypothetical protein
VASQHFPFPDFVISPELFPAGGAPQHEHIKTLLLYSSDIFKYISRHCKCAEMQSTENPSLFRPQINGMRQMGM